MKSNKKTIISEINTKQINKKKIIQINKTNICSLRELKISFLDLSIIKSEKKIKISKTIWLNKIFSANYNNLVKENFPFLIIIEYIQ